jgi:hypothetical protein
VSEQAHYDAVKALLAAGQAVPMSLTEIKKAERDQDLPEAYTELYVTERYLEPVRVDDWSSTRAWRVQTRAIGTTEANARTMRDRAREALEDHEVTVDGHTAPIGRALSHDPIGEDNSRYSGLSEYGYTL